MDITIDIDLAQAARELNLPLESVQGTVALLDDGNTVPFITRYRKDHTGALNEEQIRRIQERVGKLRALAERKRTILRSVQAQGQLTEALEEQIRAANSPKRLEDLYLPFKPKKQTLATAARQKGLEPLAAQVLQADPEVGDLHDRAQQLVAPDRGLHAPDDVLAGVRHIIAEWFSERADVRGKLRSIFHRSGKILCSRIEPTASREPQAEPQGVSAPAVTELEQDVPQNVESVAPPAFEPDPVQLVEMAGPELPSEESSGEVFQSGAVPPSVSEPLATDPMAGAPTTEGHSVSSDGEELPAETGGDELSASRVDQPQCVAEPPAVAVSADESGGGTPIGGEMVDGEPSGGEPSGGELASGEPSGGELAGRELASGEPSGGELAGDGVVETQRVVAQAAKPKAKRGPLAAAVSKNAKIAKKEKKRQRVEAAFKDYFNFQDTVARIPSHRVLAINRGERARILRVKIEGDVAAMAAEAETLLVPVDHPHGEFLKSYVRDALVRLIVPSLERELRREMMERAEEHAVEVFARNLRKLLLQPPVHGHRVLAIDPGFRSGCKLIALDEFGNVLGHEIIHVIGKEEWIRAGRAKLAETIRKHQLDVIAIGNGAACRETEQLVVDVMATELQEDDVAFLVVNEAGASVYSTSPLGREELPTFDPVLRSAVSIGRRLLDPLSELVKINPANIGVGMYQHDVKAKHLRDSLDAVVESCVNYVGVDANTASPALLRYVSGMNQLNARRLVEYRSKQGPFRTREQLKQVPGLGEGAFVQAAGFLKIANGDNPLDATWIHPESYPLAVRVLEKAGCDLGDLASSSVGGRTDDSAAPSETPVPSLSDRLRPLDLEALSQELSVSQILLRDIVNSLVRPGRDPREDFPAPVFRRGIVKLEDLTPGMKLSGTVLNVVDFGAFVDIGLSDSGLVHISRLADRFVKDPHEVVGVGDVLTVWVVDVDKQRRRVSLTAIEPGTEKAHEPRRESPRTAARQAGGRRPSGGGRSGEPRARGKAAGGAQPQARRPARPPQRPKIVTPITKEMEEGKAPLRSFSDLMQFYQKKHTDEDDTQS